MSVLELLGIVGGLSRKTVFKGNHFNVGPHRFFTKNQEVYRLFVKVAAEDLLKVTQLTRIFYDSKYQLPAHSAQYANYLGRLSSIECQLDLHFRQELKSAL